jgi:hypothetical protein
VLLLVSICGVVARKLSCLSGPDNIHVVLGDASLIDVDWQQAGRALVTGWRRRRAAEAWLAARSGFGRWIFDTLSLARLELTGGPDNVGSRRVASDVASPAKDSSVAYVR